MRIGLVLSGGMGKGAYQIGALRAISEFFAPADFECVSAASIGALNTYAFLTGNLPQAKEIWESVNLSGEKRFITSVLKSTFLQDIIASIVSQHTIKNDFYVPLLDLHGRELSYYNFKDISPNEIAPYLRASIAMPFYNKGVLIGEKSLYDGAVIDNIPISPVLKNNLDCIICLHFDNVHYIFENDDTDKKIVKISFPDNTIVKNAIYINHDAIVYMIDEGYKQVKEILSDIFSSGTDDLDAIYERIGQYDLQRDSKNVRITGDVITTNMNRLAKKVVRHERLVEKV